MYLCKPAKTTLIPFMLVALSACGGAGDNSPPLGDAATPASSLAAISSLQASSATGLASSSSSLQQVVSSSEQALDTNSSSAAADTSQSAESSRIAAIPHTSSSSAAPLISSSSSAAPTISSSSSATPVNSSSSSSQSSKLSRDIQFAAVIHRVQLQDTYQFPAIKFSGTGVLTYTSSDQKVATIDAAGSIKPLSLGYTVVSFHIEADAQYQAASGGFTIEVVNDPLVTLDKEISLEAWVGVDDTLIKFPEATAQGFKLYRSTDKACDLAFYLSCGYGQMTVFNGSPILDTANTLTRQGYYTIKDSRSQVALTLQPRDTPLRHQVIVFKDKLWSISNNSDGGISSSEDGLTWTKQPAFPEARQSHGHEAAVIDGQLKLVGGYSGAEMLAPGYNRSSVDGITWTLGTRTFDRSGHQLVNFNNKLWLIGGVLFRDFLVGSQTRETFYNDIWSSSDGNTWVKETENAAFSPRAGHKVIVFNQQLWLTGGRNSLNDLWSSNDGTTWIKQPSNASFLTRNYYQVAVHGGKLWGIGGRKEGENDMRNDVWSSSDGITWTQEIEHAPFPAESSYYNLVSFKDTLILIGYNYKDKTDEVWSSRDGLVWRKGYKGSFKFPQ